MVRMGLHTYLWRRHHCLLLSQKQDGEPEAEVSQAQESCRCQAMQRILLVEKAAFRPRQDHGSASCFISAVLANLTWRVWGVVVLNANAFENSISSGSFLSSLISTRKRISWIVEGTGRSD